MPRLGQAISWQATPRSWVMAFTLLALLLQSLAVQSHIHQLAQPQTVDIAAAELPIPTPPKAPHPVEPCRLCQELVHAGAFIVPSVTVIAAGLSFVAALAPDRPVHAGTFAGAFSWQSRAPPRH
ncbi:MAG TPA: hypothetical protein VJ750_06250 [Rhizomicrobium sp.]|nr:hypothetical protein [Rhizomicrobium sp.]